MLATAFLCAMAAGCGGDDEDESAADTTRGRPRLRRRTSSRRSAREKGEVNLVIWAGYAEARVGGWVTGSRRRRAAHVNTKDGASSDDMVDLLATGEYDGVSASGNATVRLMAKGTSSRSNTDLIPNYADVTRGSRTGLQHRGRPDVRRAARARREPADVAHGRGPAGTDELERHLGRDWPYAGKLTIYDDSIFIADAALYLKATEPDLGIENPYQLNHEQFQAAVDLLKEQAPKVGEYWSDVAKQMQSFTERGTASSARPGRTRSIC